MAVGVVVVVVVAVGGGGGIAGGGAAAAAAIAVELFWGGPYCSKNASIWSRIDGCL